MYKPPSESRILITLYSRLFFRFDNMEFNKDNIIKSLCLRGSLSRSGRTKRRKTKISISPKKCTLSCYVDFRCWVMPGIFKVRLFVSQYWSNTDSQP